MINIKTNRKLKTVAEGKNNAIIPTKVHQIYSGGPTNNLVSVFSIKINLILILENKTKQVVLICIVLKKTITQG